MTYFVYYSWMQHSRIHFVPCRLQATEVTVRHVNFTCLKYLMNSNYFNFTQEKCVNCNIVGKQFRNEDVSIIYVEEIVIYFCNFLLQYKINSVILGKLLPDFVIFHRIDYLFALILKKLNPSSPLDSAQCSA